MEAKKTPKADLENKRGAFIEIGLVIALLIMIGLFSWSQKEKVVDMLATNAEVVEQDVVDVTVEEKKPEEPAKIETANVSDLLKVVKNDAKIEHEFTILDGMDDDALANLEVKTYNKTEEVVEEEMVVFEAEEMPKFQGKGLEAFRVWVLNNTQYPQMALENNIQGKVTVSFVVERDGKLSNVKVIRGVDRELDQAAIKTISSSPKWTPAKNHGKPVRLNYIMPVDFVIN
ncbi:MAG: energy transducer TonB [Mucinivorans sp.]